MSEIERLTAMWQLATHRLQPHRRIERAHHLVCHHDGSSCDGLTCVIDRVGLKMYELAHEHALGLATHDLGTFVKLWRARSMS